MSEGELGKMAASAREDELTGFYTSDSAQSSPNTSDSEGGAKKKKSQLNDSCADEGCLDFKTQRYYIQQIKGPPSTWNDKHGSDVYKGFNVTKYIIENNFIFDPTLRHDFLLVTKVLFGRKDKGREWLSIKEKLEEVLGVFFVPGVEKMTNGLFDKEIFDKVSELLDFQVEFATYSDDEAVKIAQLALKHFLTNFKEDVKVSYVSYQAEEQDELKKGKGKKKQVAKLKEKLFEDYLATLFLILSKLTHANPDLRKSASDDIKFTTSLLGTVCPEPDFIVRNYKQQVAAVVEVKPHYRQMFPLYKGHRMPREKIEAGQAEVMETAQTSFPTGDAHVKFEVMQVTQANNKLRINPREYQVYVNIKFK